MKYYNLSDITFGQIQAFVSVVELQGFTAASEYLHVSQPVISKRVAQIEEILDMPLLIRSRSSLKLTPAGKIIYTSWKKMLNNMIESINNANIAFTGHTHQLHIAYCATGLMKSSGDLFRETHQNVELFYQKMSYPEMRASLLTGEIDIALYGSFAEPDFDPETFGFKRIFSSPFNICCAPEHPYANMESVSMSDLRNQQFVMLSPDIAPMWVTAITNMCMNNGFYPLIAMYVDEVSSLAMNTYGDNRIFITDKNVDYSTYNLVKVPIREYYSGLSAFWKKDNPNIEIVHYVDNAVKYFKTH